MSDNSNEDLYTALKDIKQSNDAIYAALVAILAHLMADESGLPKKRQSDEEQNKRCP